MHKKANCIAQGHRYWVHGTGTTLAAWFCSIALFLGPHFLYNSTPAQGSPPKHQVQITYLLLPISRLSHSQCRTELNLLSLSMQVASHSSVTAEPPFPITSFPFYS